MKMTQRALRALKLSIAHWRRLATGKRRKFESTHGGDCALCVIYRQGLVDCSGCPVMKKTGHSVCAKTPYHEANYNAITFGLDSLEFRMAARNELAFLRSLLPKKKGKK